MFRCENCGAPLKPGDFRCEYCLTNYVATQRQRTPPELTDHQKQIIHEASMSQANDMVAKLKKGKSVL